MATTEIQRLMEVVKTLKGRPKLSLAERDKLAVAKVKLAMWACRVEGLQPTEYNLARILGEESKDLLSRKQLLASNGIVLSKGGGEPAR